MVEDTNSRPKQEDGIGRSRSSLGRMRDEIIDTLAKQIIEGLETHTSKIVLDREEEEEKDKTGFSGRPSEIRDLPFYGAIHNAVLWQRDNYFLGQEFANLRKHERKNGFGVVPTIPSCNTGLGDVQIAHLGSWFIPSLPVKNALQPLVVALPNDTLRDPIRNSIVNSIPLAQPQLDSVAKTSLLSFMKNPENRDFVKNHAKGFIYNMHAGNP